MYVDLSNFNVKLESNNSLLLNNIICPLKYSNTLRKTLCIYMSQIKNTVYIFLLKCIIYLYCWIVCFYFSSFDAGIANAISSFECRNNLQNRIIS